MWIIWESESHRDAPRYGNEMKSIKEIVKINAKTIVRMLPTNVVIGVSSRPAEKLGSVIKYTMWQYHKSGLLRAPRIKNLRVVVKRQDQSGVFSFRPSSNVI